MNIFRTSFACRIRVTNDPVRYAADTISFCDGDYHRANKLIQFLDLDSNFKRAVVEELGRHQEQYLEKQTPAVGPLLNRGE